MCETAGESAVVSGGSVRWGGVARVWGEVGMWRVGRGRLGASVRVRSRGGRSGVCKHTRDARARARLAWYTTRCAMYVCSVGAVCVDAVVGLLVALL